MTKRLMNNTTKQQNIIYNVFKTIRKSIINELIIDKNTDQIIHCIWVEKRNQQL